MTKEKNKKVLFFKTVDAEGYSVLAPYPFGRKYEIGKTYVFRRKNFPAHGFRPSLFKDTSLEKLLADRGMLDYIWRNRAEPIEGSRVLICEGKWEIKEVVFYQTWRTEEGDPFIYKSRRWVFASYRFKVVGEAKPSFTPQLTFRWYPFKPKHWRHIKELIEKEEAARPR